MIAALKRKDHVKYLGVIIDQLLSFFFCECLFISYKTTITQCLLTVTQHPKSNNNNTKLNLLTHLRSHLP